MGFIEGILDRLFEHKTYTLGCEGDTSEAGYNEPYLKRWYVRKLRGEQRGLQVYVHKIMRPDHDRALHDHPWWFWSFIVKGGYTEELDNGARRSWRAPAFSRHAAEDRHRIDATLNDKPVWTIFITGPPRAWLGFLARRRVRSLQAFPG